MYATENFKTKKALKEAVKAGQQIGVWQMNDMFGADTQNGTKYLEGPYYPQPHSWYATVVVKDGVIIKVS